MRGTQTILPSSRLAAGIIPAYAGNTSTHTPRNLISRDHPRVCGEHFLADKIITTKTQIWNELGIIPAYAGNTLFVRACNYCMRDHPRVCGEHLGCLRILVPTQGSSPRMRGTPTIRPVECPRRRIIPAYAGNTRRRLCWFLSPRDHPRVCGEHPMAFAAPEPTVGSSPRMRGTHQMTGNQVSIQGIIPAYAGNTRREIRLPHLRRDHPRVCGEHNHLDERQAA